MHPSNHFIKRVLVIDDDPDDCLLLRQAMEEVSAEIDVIFCDRTAQAGEKVEEYQPHLIFLDLNIPEENGYEFLKRIKLQPNSRKIPVIIYSSTQRALDINLSYGLGAALFFRKPMRYRDIIHCLNQIFEMSWEQPEEITVKFFDKGNYLPFGVQST